MAHRLVLPSGFHGWHLPEYIEEHPVIGTHPEPVSDAFLVGAGAWFTATMAGIVMVVAGALPGPVGAYRVMTALLLGGGVAALSVFCAMLYRLPRDHGGMLRSPLLARAHFLALQAGALVALRALLISPPDTDAGEGLLLTALVGLNAGGLVCLFGNMIGSLASFPVGPNRS